MYNGVLYLKQENGVITFKILISLSFLTSIGTGHEALGMCLIQYVFIPCLLELISTFNPQRACVRGLQVVTLSLCLSVCHFLILEKEPFSGSKLTPVPLNVALF